MNEHIGKAHIGFLIFSVVVITAATIGGIAVSHPPVFFYAIGVCWLIIAYEGVRIYRQLRPLSRKQKVWTFAILGVLVGGIMIATLPIGLLWPLILGTFAIGGGILLAEIIIS